MISSMVTMEMIDWTAAPATILYTVMLVMMS